MAKKARNRWNDWRVNLNGQSIKSKPKQKKPARKPKQSGQDSSSSSWWWIKAKFPSKCEACHRGIQKGQVICYRHQPKRVLCRKCANGTNVASGAAHSGKRSKSAQATERNRLPAEEYFQIGDRHPTMEGWVWDGEAFTRL